MARKSTILTLLLAIFSVSLVATLASHPQTSFQAALEGLKVWWDVVFPALLPFIVLSEILMGIGVVHFVGVLLEPIMRPCFNVPGTGGFVLTMGFSSGYPVAAKLTSRLREQGNLSRTEGERLVTFTTTSDPLFVIGAVAVGFFQSEQLGFIMAIVHYGSAVLLGFMFRFHAYQEVTTAPYNKNNLPLILRALQAMHRARLKDGRPFGQLMGDAVQSALNTLLMVGGFLIVFSVIIQLLSVINLTQLLTAILAVILGPLGIPADFSAALISGLFEVTLGSQATSEVPAHIPFLWKAAIASGLISWGGLSVHAQVASILARTDIRVTPYLIGRAIHGVMAAFLTVLLWEPLSTLAYQTAESIPVFGSRPAEHTVNNWWQHFFHSSTIAITIFTVLLLIAYLSKKAAGKRI